MADFGLDFLSFAGSALDVGSKLYRGWAGSQAGELGAKISALNTETNKLNAQTERERGDYALVKAGFESSRLLERVRMITANQAAYFGANNIDAATGSPLALAGLTAAQGDVDAGLIRARGGLEKADADVRAASFTARAAGSAYQEVAEHEKATSALISGYLGAGTSLLSSMSKWKGLTGTAPKNKTVGGGATFYDPWAPEDL